MKKAVISFIILALFTGTVFLAGWVQLAIPAGKYGVVISKTGGVNPETVIPGRFRWTWERLLPTNATLLVFDLKPVSKTVTVAGTLPSGMVYGAMIEGKPDFSWKTTVSLTGRISAAALPEVIRRDNIRDQKALDEWTEKSLASIANECAARFVDDTRISTANENGVSPGTGNFLSYVNAKITTPGIEMISATIAFQTMPDFALYDMAAKAYTEYQKRRQAMLSASVTREADAAATDYLQMERLERWGEILTKYPILIEYLAVTRDDGLAAFKALRNLGKTER